MFAFTSVYEFDQPLNDQAACNKCPVNVLERGKSLTNKPHQLQRIEISEVRKSFARKRKRVV